MCRYGDVLYVTEVTKDSLLTVGDKIIEINGASVKAFLKSMKNAFTKKCQNVKHHTGILYLNMLMK